MAFANAPEPSTRKLPALSDALVTLMAVTAADGAAVTTARIDSAVNVTAQRPTLPIFMPVIGFPIPGGGRASAGPPAVLTRRNGNVTPIGGDLPWDIGRSTTGAG